MKKWPPARNFNAWTRTSSSYSRGGYISESGTAVALWDVEKGERTGMIGSPDREKLFSSAFSVAHNGKLLALADNEAGALLVYDVSTRRAKQRIEFHQGRHLSDLAFSLDGTVVVSLDSADVVEGWSIENGESIYRTDLGRRLREEFAVADAGVFDPFRGGKFGLRGEFLNFNGILTDDGSLAAFWNNRGIARVFSTRSGNEAFRYDAPQGTSSRTSIALATRGDVAAMPTEKLGVIRLIRIPSGEKIGEIALTYDVGQLAFSNDGRYLGVGTQFRVRLFDVNTRTELPATKGEEAWWKAAFSENDETLFLEGSDTVSAWDWRQKKQRWRTADRGLIGLWKDAMLGVVQANATAILRNGKSGELIERVTLPTWDGKSERTYFNPLDGTVNLSELITRASFNRERLVYQVANRLIAVYSLETQKAVFMPLDNSHLFESAEFMPNDVSRLLTLQRKSESAFGGAKRIVVVSVETGKPVYTKETSENVRGVVAAPDGNQIVAIGTRSNKESEKITTLTWWRIGQDRPIASVEFSGWSIPTIAFMRRPNLPARFSPDGKHLLIGDSDGRIHVIDSSMFTEVKVCEMHRGEITSINYGAHGNILVTTALDGVRIGPVLCQE